MTEKHGMSPEFENLKDLLRYVNTNQNKILPPEKLQAIKDKNEKNIIEKIKSIENVAESEAKKLIPFYINIYDKYDPTKFALTQLKKTIKNFPNLKDEVINKIDVEIDQEKIPSKVEALEELRDKIKSIKQ